MLRRVFLYCLRGWKKSVTLLVMCTVLFSVLLALFPIRRAASSAADALSLSLGTAFSMSMADNTKTSPELYEKKPQEGGGFSYVYIGAERLDDSVIDAVMAIDGVDAYNVDNFWWFYLPDLTLRPGIYAKTIPGEGSTSVEYDLAGRQTSTVFFCMDSSRQEYFLRGALKLIEGRHITPDDRQKAVISTYLAETNDLEIGDMIHTESLKLQYDGRGTREDLFGSYELEIIGLFDVISDQFTEPLSVEVWLAENHIFSDYNTCRLAFDDIARSIGTESEANFYSNVTFFIDDPAKLSDIMQQVKSSTSFTPGLYNIRVANPAYAQSIAPLTRLRSLCTAFLIVLAVGLCVLLHFLLKSRLLARRREVAVLLACGVSKARVAMQLFLELFLILAIAFCIACPIGNALAMRFGNDMYEMTLNETTVETEDGTEQKVLPITKGQWDSFINTPSFAPDAIEVAPLSASEILLAAGACCILTALSVAIPVRRLLKTPPQRLFSRL